MQFVDQTFLFSILLSGIITALFCWLIVLTKEWHGKHSGDLIIGIQKFHTAHTPRIGGLAMFVGLIIAETITVGPQVHLLKLMLISSLPTFAAGLAEDISKKVGIRTRLFASMLSGVAAWSLTGYALNQLNIQGVDALLAYLPIAVAFTAFCVAGVVHATNIIDGFNGLASGTVIICLSALGLIAWQAGDIQLAQITLILIAVVTGFLVINFPFGKIFMGDGGAYLLGFMLAWVAVMLPIRNPSVSVWAPFLVCSYPIIETIYSMARRTHNKVSPGHPDISHMHSLIKTKIITPYLPQIPKALRNAIVSPFCWLYTLIPATMATQYYTQPDTLIITWLITFALYHTIYKQLNNIKIPTPPPNSPSIKTRLKIESQLLIQLHEN